jgi:putative NADH-flavin reductase
MKIVIFGATGRTGRHLIEEALARGHGVRAFGRSAPAAPVRDDRISVVQGDVLDGAAVEGAVAGTDAVLCALGPTKTGPVNVCSEGVKNILAAMEEHRNRRLVCMTGAMIGHDRRRLGLVLRAMRWLSSHLAGAMMDDRRLQEELIRRSSVDWTIVRPPRLTNAPRTGSFRIGEDIRLGSLARIARADVAHFMVEQLEWVEFLRKAPAIAY